MAETQFSFAKNSELVFTVSGRHLCSSINPTKEAQQWVAGVQDQWQGCESIVVLGLGCGYHVRALRVATNAQVIAVDIHRDVIAGALRVHPLDLKESEIVYLESMQNLSANEALMQVTRKSYAVLLHEPSVFLNRDLYLSARRFLLGRNEAGIKWLFQNRNLQVNENFHESGIVGLQHLDTILPADRSESSVLLQALRELIV